MSDFMVILSIPILLVLGVLYVLLGGLLINALKLVYVMLTSKDFVFYTVLGDLSWLFPFKPNELDFRFTNLLLVCILLVGISGLMIGWSYLHRWQENENNKNKILLELLAKQSASSVNKEEQPVSQNAPVTQENVGQKEPPKPAETKKNK